MSDSKPLAVYAEMTLDYDSQRVHIRGNGPNLIFEVPDVGSAFRFVRSVLSTRLRSHLGMLSATLRHAGISVKLRTPKRRLLTVGAQQSSRLLRRLGFPNVSLHLK